MRGPAQPCNTGSTSCPGSVSAPAAPSGSTGARARQHGHSAHTPQTPLTGSACTSEPNRTKSRPVSGARTPWPLTFRRPSAMTVVAQPPVAAQRHVLSRRTGVTWQVASGAFIFGCRVRLSYIRSYTLGGVRPRKPALSTGCAPRGTPTESVSSNAAQAPLLELPQGSHNSLSGGMPGAVCFAGQHGGGCLGARSGILSRTGALLQREGDRER